MTAIEAARMVIAKPNYTESSWWHVDKGQGLFK
jgi:hypothetical protein